MRGRFAEALVRGEVGPAARLLRLPLYPLSWLYRCAVTARNALYDAGLVPVRRAPVPVISVGNLSAGGTGKTPLVIELARLLASKGAKPAVASRCYGAPSPGEPNDEALLVEAAGFRVFCGRDRHECARRAAEAGADVVLLDDGFQHRRLHRELDIVTVDAFRPPWEDRLLPAGLLREPLSSLARADAAVIVRAVPGLDVSGVERRLSELCGGAPTAVYDVVPSALLSPEGGEEDPRMLEGRKVFAFCGTGSPGRFRATLEALGAEVAGFAAFPDHHAYRKADLERVEASAEEAGAEVLVCTAKDGVKCAAIDRPRKYHILQIRLQPASGAEELEEKVCAAAGLGAR